jgi:hypothetical protein
VADQLVRRQSILQDGSDLTALESFLSNDNDLTFFPTESNAEPLVTFGMTHLILVDTGLDVHRQRPWG